MNSKCDICEQDLQDKEWVFIPGKIRVLCNYHYPSKHNNQAEQVTYTNSNGNYICLDCMKKLGFKKEVNK